MKTIQTVGGIRNQLNLNEYLGTFSYSGPQDLKPSILSVGSDRPKSANGHKFKGQVWKVKCQRFEQVAIVGYREVAKISESSKGDRQEGAHDPSRNLARKHALLTYKKKKRVLIRSLSSPFVSDPLCGPVFSRKQPQHGQLN